MQSWEAPQYLSVLLSGSEKAVIATSIQLTLCVERSFSFSSMISHIKTKHQLASS